MPKNKFQDVVLTAIMATIMVYGMVVYNVALATGGLTAESFLLALYELPIMVPIAFVLEFFAVGKIARRLAFTVMRCWRILVAALGAWQGIFASS